MTKRECAIVTAYTGVCMLEGNDLGELYKYVEEKMGRAVYTHEMYTFADEIKEKSKDDFIELCRTARDTEKEKYLDVIDEEINKLQPPYKHIAVTKALMELKEKIKALW